MKLRNYLVLLAIAGAVVALDQWSKYFVRTALAFGELWAPIPGLENAIRVVHWNNTGAAFGLFPSGSMLFTVVAVIVSLAILYYYPRVPSGQVPLRLALALQLGGALGNLIDRVAQGTVTDFIAVGSFPVFNLADASISAGVAVLVVSMWVEERRARREKDRVADAGSPGETGASEAQRRPE